LSLFVGFNVFLKAQPADFHLDRGYGTRGTDICPYKQLPDPLCAPAFRASLGTKPCIVTQGEL